MEIEINQVDLKYKDIRLSLPDKERTLLVSIQENGFFENLSCIESKNSDPILIDGFKRFRCAQKLNILKIPVSFISDNDVDGLIQVIRNHQYHTLTIIEQAAIIEKLFTIYRLSNSDIAKKLGRSPAWVSLRQNFIQKTSESIKLCIFEGKFPLRSYMYSLLPFTRVKNFDQKKIDEFVDIAKGKDLSTRDIDLLAKGFFSGDSQIETQIRDGDLDWTVRQLRELETQSKQNKESKTQIEFTNQNHLLKDIGLIYHLMGKLSYPSSSPPLLQEERLALRDTVTLIEKQFPVFISEIRRMYDR